MILVIACLLGAVSASDLLKAIDSNNLSQMNKALLKSRADATIADAHGLTVMHVAADRGQDRVLQVLITNGIDTANALADGLTPLHRAVMNGHTATVKVLLMHSALDKSAASKVWDVLTGDGKTVVDLSPNTEMAAVVKKFTETGGKAAKEDL